MKKKIFFLGGFLVVEMKKKIVSEKKKCRNLEWATAYYGVESRYNAFYRDRQGREAGLGTA